MIREMTIEDVPVLAAIEAENSQTPWDENGLFTYFIRNDTLFLVAEEAGEVLGFLGILLIPWESEVLEITVKQSARNRGLGGALMDEAKRRLPEHKVTVIYLEVRESNDPARHLYKKQGFKEEGKRKRYYTDPVEDAVIMSCHLTEE